MCLYPSCNKTWWLSYMNCVMENKFGVYLYKAFNSWYLSLSYKHFLSYSAFFSFLIPHMYIINVKKNVEKTWPISYYGYSFFRTFHLIQDAIYSVGNYFSRTNLFLQRIKNSVCVITLSFFLSKFKSPASTKALYI